MGGRLDQIGNLGCLWDLLSVDHDLVRVVAELTLPDLVPIDLLKHAGHVEDALALDADLSITSCHVSLVGEAGKSHFEHVGVELLPVDLGLLLRACPLLGLEFPAECSLIHAIFLVTQVELTTKIVRVHLFARKVAIDISLDRCSSLERCSSVSDDGRRFCLFLASKNARSKPLEEAWLLFSSLIENFGGLDAFHFFDSVVHVLGLILDRVVHAIGLILDSVVHVLGLILDGAVHVLGLILDGFVDVLSLIETL